MNLTLLCLIKYFLYRILNFLVQNNSLCYLNEKLFHQCLFNAVFVSMIWVFSDLLYAQFMTIINEKLFLLLTRFYSFLWDTIHRIININQTSTITHKHYYPCYRERLEITCTPFENDSPGSYTHQLRNLRYAIK